MNCLPLFVQTVPWDARLQCPGVVGARHSMAEAAGQPLGSGLLAGSSSISDHTETDVLTTVCSKENESF